MKRMIIPILIAVSVLLGGTTAVLAGNVNEAAGYVDFSKLSIFKTHEPEVEISIDKDLLQVIAAGLEGSEAEEAEYARQVSQLQLVKVYTFAIKESEYAGIARELETVYTQLDKGNWKTIVKVRDAKGGKEGKNVRVAYKKSGELIDGLVVITLNEGKLVFVNIVGNLDLKYLGKLGNQFNVGLPSGSEKGENAKSGK